MLLLLFVWSHTDSNSTLLRRAIRLLLNISLRPEAHGKVYWAWVLVYLNWYGELLFKLNAKPATGYYYYYYYAAFNARAVCRSYGRRIAGANDKSVVWYLWIIARPRLWKWWAVSWTELMWKHGHVYNVYESLMHLSPVCHHTGQADKLTTNRTESGR